LIPGSDDNDRAGSLQQRIIHLETTIKDQEDVIAEKESTVSSQERTITGLKRKVGGICNKRRHNRLNLYRLMISSRKPRPR
jgi:uncharacterized coiled-coil protein SlyX